MRTRKPQRLTSEFYFFMSLKRSPMSPRKSSMERTGFKRKAVSVKSREGSWRDWAKKLECLLARYVKVRDGFRCKQFGDKQIQCTGPLDAGHIYPKGKFPGGKFLKSNIQAQCRRHNGIHISQPTIMLTHYEEVNGEGSLERLHELVLSMPRRPSKEWLVETHAEITSELSALEAMAAAEV